MVNPPTETSVSHKSHRRIRLSADKAKRSAIRVVAAGLFLLLAVLIAGFLYVWLTGQDSTVTSLHDTSDVVEKPKLPVPAESSESAQVGVSVQAYSSQMERGATNTIAVRTRKLATCSIKKEIEKITSSDTHLDTKQADEYGMVYWNWKTDPDSPSGEYILHITCSYGEKSGYYRLVIKLR